MENFFKNILVIILEIINPIAVIIYDLSLQTLKEIIFLIYSLGRRLAYFIVSIILLILICLDFLVIRVIFESVCIPIYQRYILRLSPYKKARLYREYILAKYDDEGEYY
jgi:hypothetical protein